MFQEAIKGVEFIVDQGWGGAKAIGWKDGGFARKKSEDPEGWCVLWKGSGDFVPV